MTGGKIRFLGHQKQCYRVPVFNTSNHNENLKNIKQTQLIEKCIVPLTIRLKVEKWEIIKPKGSSDELGIRLNLDSCYCP